MTLTAADTRLTPGSPLVPRQCPSCNRHLTLADFYRCTYGTGYRRSCKRCVNRGVSKAGSRPTTQARVAERREDIEFMLATSAETLEGAAARLGITPAGLERWCHRHAPDLLQRLNAEDYGHVRQGRIGRAA